MKTCSKCKLTKSFDEFYVCKMRSAGYRSSCKMCMDKKSKEYNELNPTISDKIKKKYRYNNQEKIRNTHLIYKYGIDSLEYERMHTAQAGVCGICFLPETVRRNGVVQKLTVDHCHKTGQIRGLLCRGCNSAIGKLKDSVQILGNAIAYLENK